MGVLGVLAAIAVLFGGVQAAVTSHEAVLAKRSAQPPAVQVSAPSTPATHKTGI